MTAVVMAAGALAGFAAGLFTFKVKSRWCPECGASLCCPVCLGHQRALSSSR